MGGGEGGREAVGEKYVLVAERKMDGEKGVNTNHDTWERTEKIIQWSCLLVVVTLCQSYIGGALGTVS